jgi:hypothetical protein
MAAEVLKKVLENSTILRFLTGLVTQKSGSRFSRRITTGGVEMDEVAMLRRAEPREILEKLVEKHIPAIVSYLSKGKWHVAKVLLSELGAYRLSVDIQPNKKPHPVNIQMDQPVGVSLKYGYGKFIFESKVLALEPSSDQKSGGTIVLSVPDRIEIVQRRNYFRVDVPHSLKVNTLLWPRRQQGDKREPASANADAQHRQEGPEQFWQGRLVDISAGGAQVALDVEHKDDLRVGQFLGIRFTPMPYEMPVMFNAQIRNVLPTADGKNVCLGLQIVGLEASLEGRDMLKRLCSIVESYHQMNQSGVKPQDFRRMPSVK